MAAVKFRCIKCGGETLEEVLAGVIQTSVVTAIDDSGAMEYDPDRISYDGGEVCHYQCHDCGHIVKDQRNVELDKPGWLVETLKGIGAEDNPVKKSYEGGVCPDCQEPIPDDVIEGECCINCKHVFCMKREDDDL